MKILNSLFVAILLLGVVSPVQSQEVNTQKRPCKTDYEKFCKDIKPGQGRIAKCIAEHKDELSQSCKDHIETVSGIRRDFQKSCKGDFNKFCYGEKPGAGRIITCLKQHESELSENCSFFLQDWDTFIKNN